ncbi:TetR/AcrR family transcriptional regulator [Micromonospora musae]|uniref:TetR/AcrR family transcriptional regulator n=1 Tax=Micromonospora musae TaxID=1894970 RepID=UPI00342ECC3D
MRTWTADDPKAALMTRKREAIVTAALDAFLEEGYAGSSVNRIAAQAGVSIKTLYRHFENKDDLFIAVIEAACATTVNTENPPWLDLEPLDGLTAAGLEQLRFVLAPQQLGLYRVVTRDAPRFPQLGRRYREHLRALRNEQFHRYLDRWPAQLRARISNADRAADTFFALLQAEELAAALHGGTVPGPDHLQERARETALDLLALVQAGRL